MPFYAKTVFYMLQNLYWLRDGVYYQNRKELAAHLRGEDQQLFNIMEKTRQGSRSLWSQPSRPFSSGVRGFYKDCNRRAAALSC